MASLQPGITHTLLGSDEDQVNSIKRATNRAFTPLTSTSFHITPINSSAWELGHLEI